MGIRVDCDFVEDTERGEYCELNHCACDSENCEILKYGICREDIEQGRRAQWEIMNQHL